MADVHQSIENNFDAVIVGAGFAGMYMLYRLRNLGFSVQVYERGDGVGGTWYWNRYPGARCDVESMEYSYQFSEELQQEWEWTERYAAQPEILKYANHVADRFDLRRGIQFNTSVESAVFDEEQGLWVITTDDKKAVSAQFCIMATGCLSSTNTPDFKGIESFQGDTYHTGKWPHEPVDFTGQRIGIIGTGSSAIQSIPIIAKQAKELFVFQRTANYSVPAQNGSIDPEYQREIKANYTDFRARNNLMPAGFGANNPSRGDTSVLTAPPEEQAEKLQFRWDRGGLGLLGAFNDFMLTHEANEIAAEFVHDKIRSIVKDPDVAKLLCPDQVIGCKRLCVDTDYYETYNQSHVHLIDIKNAPVETITPNGLRTGGQEYEFDSLIFATGFDAMTGTLLRIDIRGRDNKTLNEKWAEGPKTYLGLGIVGFPNLFTISGPGSPSVLTNMIVSIEQHVNWIADCIDYMRESKQQCIEATSPAEEAWVSRVNTLASFTLYPSCNSWYLGANIPGKPRVFMPHLGFPDYATKCAEVASNNYEGFVLS
ncbi:MAG: NAD(P)/FAD-dependent oxidoreductase [Pseudomonadota bacterium]